MSKFFEDFKKFALKGNVMDMAIGVVIGGAFSKIVSSLVNDIIMPFFSLFTSTTQFTSLKLVMRPEVLDEMGAVIRAEAAITYGAFIQNVVDFLLIALSIFLCIRFAAKIRDRFLKKKEEPAPEPAGPAAPTQEELLAEIRDLLKEATASASGIRSE
ncbi:MAG: large-conductance mechanosensitive channel protein MscL [Oscillospiraceae bacterium]|nr:large-conductance mechanosensitive channel protein MscL [Oscillospiraceae bacterium]